MKWDKIISAITGFFGGVFGFLFGEPDIFFYCLLSLVCIDYISGVIAAAHQKSLSSKIGFLGICKKVLIFLIVATANIADKIILHGEDVLRTAVISFFLMNEGISILENASNAGLQIPSALKKAFDLLKNNNVDKNNTDDSKDDNSAK